MQEPGHRLHRAALGGELTSGNYALLDRRLVRLKELDGAVWQVETLDREPLRAPAEQLLAVRRASELPILIGEPFVVTAQGQTAHWESHIRAQLGNQRRGAVQVVSQAQMALWAHGIEHGIVVNIGQQQSIAAPWKRASLSSSIVVIMEAI